MDAWHVPALGLQRLKVVGERGRVDERCQLTEEDELAGLVCDDERLDHAAAEQRREHTHRQQELRTGPDPLGAIGRQTGMVA